MTTTANSLQRNRSGEGFLTRTRSGRVYLLHRARVHEGKKARALFLSLGETDEWAHMGRYDLYVRAAHRFDQYVKALWETA
jgi:hypothetical protein